MARYQRTGEARVLNRRIEISGVDKTGPRVPGRARHRASFPRQDRRFSSGFFATSANAGTPRSGWPSARNRLRLATDAAEIGTWDLDLVTGRSDVVQPDEGDVRHRPRRALQHGRLLCRPASRRSGATSRAFASALDPALRAPYDVRYRTIGKGDGVVRWVAAKGKGLFDERAELSAPSGRRSTSVPRRPPKRATPSCSNWPTFCAVCDTDRGAERSERPDGALFRRVAGRLRSPRSGRGPVRLLGLLDRRLRAGPPGTISGAGLRGQDRRQAHRGETVVVDDLMEAAISDEPETRQIASSVNTRAILVVPLVREGRLRTIVYLNDRLAREWTAGRDRFHGAGRGAHAASHRARRGRGGFARPERHSGGPGRATDRGPAGSRGSASPVAEDGGGRPADRRHRARLQQSADRHLGQPRAAAGPRGAGAHQRSRALHYGGSRRCQSARPP